MRWFRRASAQANDAPTPPPVLFVHVMKTGGTTIVRNLRETYPLEVVFPYSALDLVYREDGELDLEHHLSVPYLLGLSPERRETIRVYIGHFPYVVRELLGFEVRAATMLRDPVERTISLLRQLQRPQRWEDDAVERPLAMRRLEEVYEHPLVFEPLVHDHQTKIFSMMPADDPQRYTDLIEVDGARLERAKASLEEIEVVGITERFDELLDELESRFGWTIVRGARKNATPERDLTPVAASLRRRIAADNAIDTELYEYAKDLVAMRRSRRTSA